MKSKFLGLILLLAVYAVTCLAIATGSYFREGLVLKVGDYAPQRIKANATVENRVATERNKAEAERLAAEMKPLYTHDAEVTERVINNVNTLLTDLGGIRTAYIIEATEKMRLAAEQRALVALAQSNPAVTPAAGPALETDGIVPEAEASPTATPVPSPAPSPTPVPISAYDAYALFDKLPVNFTPYQRETILTIESAAFNDLTQRVREVTGDILDQNVTALDTKTITAVRDEFLWNGDTSQDLSVIGSEIVITYLEPNYPIDEELTEEQRQEIAESYEVVMVEADQTIVEADEVITADIYALLEALGMLNSNFMDKIIPMAGVFILIAALYAACIMHMAFFKRPSTTWRKEVILICTLYGVVLVIMRLLGNVHYAFLPVLIFPMLVSILVDLRTSILLTLFLVVSGYFVVNGSMEYLMFHLAAGTLFCLMAKYTTERNKIFIVGLLASVSNFVISCALALVTEKNNAPAVWQTILLNGGYAALNGMFTVIFCIGSLPFWETFFGVVTPIKLLDLTNPTNLLLRRLTIEAPGTYHHSLIVANLAETAAYDIGANPHTARVGGYYHDIGKLKYPQYFIENIAGENPHDSMDPYNSAQLIISHIAYGLTLAADYRLPQFIRDVIQEHHGTTIIRFFYCRAKDAAAGKPINENDFRYPYVKPQTRESACVMLADTVEAAVRSMIPRVKSVDEVEDQINGLVRGKLNDGQLSDSNLSIKDVDIICASFFRVLKGMYHERIPYPKISDEEETKRLSDTGKIPRLLARAGGK